MRFRARNVDIHHGIVHGFYLSALGGPVAWHAVLSES